MNNNQTALRIGQTVLLLLAPLYAQNWAVHATIPFDFTADQQAFAAGRYCISTDGGATVRLTRGDSHHKAEVITVLLRSASQAIPRIIFHSYGERHFLAELWLGEPNLVRQVYASAAEQDLARTTKQELTIVIATVVGPKQLRSNLKRVPSFGTVVVIPKNNGGFFYEEIIDHHLHLGFVAHTTLGDGGFAARSDGV